MASSLHLHLSSDCSDNREVVIHIVMKMEFIEMLDLPQAQAQLHRKKHTLVCPSPSLSLSLSSLLFSIILLLSLSLSVPLISLINHPLFVKILQHRLGQA